MTNSVITPVAALWALILLPVLCMGGIWDHQCHEAHEGASCEHENHCDGEDCVDVPLPDSQAPSLRIPIPSPDFTPAFRLSECHAELMSPQSRGSSLSPAMAGGPFPQGGSPLLI